MGGLGNQLFQIFNTIAYSIRYGKEFGFPYSETLKTGIERPTYWDTLFKSIKDNTHTSLPRMPLYRERLYSYIEIPKLDPTFMFYGYFQSYKYFEDFQDKIYEILQLRDQQTQVQEEHPFDYNNTISIHFRIGDYASKQNYHPVMTPSYYKHAIQKLTEDTSRTDWKILYFYQEEDHDLVHTTIQELKVTYPDISFTPVEHSVADWKQMLMMSLCRHNIIANSSFSWWGAYFNLHKETNVYYPSVWFGPSMKHNDTKDLCPSDWNMINVT